MHMPRREFSSQVARFLKDIDANNPKTLLVPLVLWNEKDIMFIYRNEGDYFILNSKFSHTLYQ